VVLASLDEARGVVVRGTAPSPRDAGVSMSRARATAEGLAVGTVAKTLKLEPERSENLVHLRRLDGTTRFVVVRPQALERARLVSFGSQVVAGCRSGPTCRLWSLG
jgi:hypothetical protein